MDFLEGNMSTVAELIIEILVASGVKRIFGIAGDSLNAFTDAIRKNRKIDWIHVRHEETAAFAAGAEAQLSGSLAVCAGSCGPGNLHLINGLYECHRNRVPVLAIASHIPTTEIGGNYFQETHPERIFLECSSFCETVTQIEQIPRLLEIAMQTAISLPDVAVLIIPGDIAWKKASYKGAIRNKALMQDHSTYYPSEEKLNEAAEFLNHDEKITILAGIGCAEAHRELLEVADILKAPIVMTLRSKEHLEHDNPFKVGLTGLIGLSSGYHAMMDCTTLLLLGTDFPYRQFYPKDAKVIQVDKRLDHIGRRTPVDCALVGDVKHTLNALKGKLTPKKDRSFLDCSLERYKKARHELDELAIETEPSTPLHPQYVAKLVDESAASDAIFTCDVGTPTIWAARYLKMNGKRRLLGSFNHGTMASALPQAIGAQLLYPDRQVISFSGDGGIAMLMGDLLTLKQLNLPIKIVVFNNGTLGFVELEMKAVGVLEFGTNLVNPNFAKMAESIGILGIRVDSSQKLKKDLQDAFNYPGPALIDIVVNPLELSLPPKITLHEMFGFGIYAAKAILNGRGNEIIELARTNLFNS